MAASSTTCEVRGLGVRRAADLAPAAYLASTYSTANLVSAILGQHSSSQPLPPAPFSDSAVEKWSHGLDIAPPVDHGVLKEKNWDTLRTSSMAESLLGSSVDATERARLLAAMDKNSGAWLQALPISSIGLRLDNPSLRIAVGLRLGTAICASHHCQFCGAEVSSLGLHGLCCRKSEGRHSRHASLNDIIKRSLSTAGIPSRLEPPGLSCSDGQRPDGMTLVPWSSGHPLVWDATCPDTFASSYESRATLEAGGVASLVEERKSAKYAHLAPQFIIQPVAIETSGAIGPSTLSFLEKLGRRIHLATGDPRSTQFLLQRLSVVVQRGNTAAILGSTVN